MFYLSIYLFEIFLNQWAAFCSFFMPPTLVKLAPTLVKLEGVPLACLSLCGWVYCWGGCLLVGVYASGGGGVQRCGWLAGSVGHFFSSPEPLGSQGELIGWP